MMLTKHLCIHSIFKFIHWSFSLMEYKSATKDAFSTSQIIKSNDAHSNDIY